MSTVITRKVYNKLQEELRDMREVQQPAIRDRIAAARDMGDLSENAEYHSAREELSMLMYKISKLEDRLATARIVDEHEIDLGSVKVFTKITLQDLNRNREVIFQPGGARRDGHHEGQDFGVQPHRQGPDGQEGGRAG